MSYWVLSAYETTVTAIRSSARLWCAGGAFPGTEWYTHVELRHDGFGQWPAFVEKEPVQAWDIRGGGAY